ncbi:MULTISPECIES: hypothetical protein [Xanthomonas]|uniref:hypothetical protein n=1 Tax=Xanthomonas cannabis TaxID=1885674 RepID=UPI0016174537|nr:hypothetical protein [Xanthomonas campestris pv. zinniae]
MMVIGCFLETMGLGLRHWSPAGRLVDHWQELERHVAAPAPSMVNLSDPAAPRSLLASYTSHDGQHSRWIYHHPLNSARLNTPAC